MRFVQTIESNLKNHTTTTALGPKTLILGPNRAGKSAIVNALEFALTATVSDLVGRALVKEVNRLLSLSRDPGSIFARAVLDDDQVIECKSKGKKVLWSSQPDVYNPATVFPLRTVREALAGGPETTRRFFIRFVAGAVTDSDVLNEIPRPLHKRYQQVLASTPKTAAVDALLAAMAGAKERALALRAEIATRKDIMKEAGVGLAAPPSGDLLARAEAHVTKLQEQVRDLERDLNMEQGREAQRARFIELRARQEEIESAMANGRNRIAEAHENWPEQPGENDELRQHHLAVLRFAANQRLSSCPTCKGENITPTFWDIRVETVEAAAAKSAAKVEAFQAHRRTMNEVEAELEELSHDWNKNAAQLEALGVMPDAIDQASYLDAYEQLKNDLEAARIEVRKLEQAKAAWEPIMRARDSAAEKEVEYDEWYRLVVALQATIGNLLDKARDAFVARVQAFMPAGDTFGLLLHDEDREVCQYGLMRDGRLQEALSGVEWAFVTAAIAAAAIPDQEQDKLHVVVFEDRAWDIDTMRAVMKATSKLQAQVIIATTPPFDWSGGVDEGWTLIDLCGGSVATADSVMSAQVDLGEQEQAQHEVARLGKELEKAWKELADQKEINRKAGLIDEVRQPDGTFSAEVVEKPRRKKKAAPAVDPGMPPELE